MDSNNSGVNFNGEAIPELKPLNENATNVSPTPEKKSGCLKIFLGLVIGLVVVFVLLITMSVTAVGLLIDSLSEIDMDIKSSNISTAVLRDGTGPRIAVVDIKGIILRGKISGGTDSIKISKLLGELDGYDAIILDMDTPGGEVVAADEIHGALKKLRAEDESLKIVTCMHSMAASGGYYIAAASDHIVANRMTITGSIGVIMSTYNITGLMGKIGVEEQVFRSGDMKDMLSMTRPVTDRERTYMNQLVESTFNEFATIVAEGRSAYETAEDVKKAPFGDGRVLSGADALEYKLVDELGDFDTAVAAAVKLVCGEEGEDADNAEPLVERVSPGVSFMDALFEMSSRMSWQSRLIPGNAAVMKPGQLYYMLPAAAL